MFRCWWGTVMWAESIKLTNVLFSYVWRLDWKIPLYLQTCWFRKCNHASYSSEELIHLVGLCLHTETTVYHISEPPHETRTVAVSIFAISACSCICLPLCHTFCWRWNTVAILRFTQWSNWGLWVCEMWYCISGWMLDLLKE